MKTNNPVHAALPAVSVLLFVVTFLVGCASTHEVKVHSMAKASSSGRELESYVIRSTRAHAPADTLRLKEAERHIKTALSGQGMWEAPNPEMADLIVDIEYGIEPAKTTYSVITQPIFAPVVDTQMELEAAANRASANAGNIPAQRRVIGYKETVVPVVVREKHLLISGRENREPDEGRAPAEIFRVSASIEDESRDLRGRLPVLVSAAMDQIGRTTDGIASARIKEHDEAVKFVKRGM